MEHERSSVAESEQREDAQELNADESLTDSLSKANSIWSPKNLRFGAIVLLTIGVGVAGAAIGWWVRDARGDSQASLRVEAVVDRPVSVVSPSDTPLGRMPAVLGLPLDQARRVLFDSGIPADAINVAQQPSALEQGLVLLQDPPASSALSGSVSLVVSVEAAVPNLVGLSADDAQALLEDLGAKPTIQLRFDPNSAPGTVLASTPSTGEILERSIVLEVSSR